MPKYKYLQFYTSMSSIHAQGYVEAYIDVDVPTFYDGFSPSDVIQCGWELIGPPVKDGSLWYWFLRAEVADASA